MPIPYHVCEARVAGVPNKNCFNAGFLTFLFLCINFVRYPETSYLAVVTEFMRTTVYSSSLNLNSQVWNRIDGVLLRIVFVDFCLYLNMTKDLLGK